MQNSSGCRSPVQMCAGYVYRLELPWQNMCGYFGKRLCYRKFTKLDLKRCYEFDFSIGVNQEICGLWFFKELEDAITFQNDQEFFDERAICVRKNITESPEKQKLIRHTFVRFCSRIQASAFNGEKLYPDNLLENYKSSYFHPRVFDKGDVDVGRRSSQAGSQNCDSAEADPNLVHHVNVADELVQIYFEGAWYPKSATLGRHMETILRSDGSADKIRLKPDSVSAPCRDSPE